ncbi:hypothetical protein KUTeg_018177 [Tegillarca granosa]|uniref:Uncharacterized protein n=1 Tax=Tegillarca granosa TaxID=220873 RepID=A0ABQ9EH12_TEGGR|nr:hypothetical protein KUTeg_018177 [Tegillarca granosa]
MNVSQGSGRLTLSAALSRNTSLDSSWTSSTTQTKSASLAKAEKEIKALKDENKKMRKDLDDMRSLYNQIITENSHEKFDERRITVLLMSEALSSRSVTLSEVENALSWLADKWRYYIGLDIKGPEVNVQRSDLTKMVETAESARIKLYKNLENTSTDRLAIPLVFMNEFLKPGKQEETTVFDIALGKTENLNLKHVGKLETKLALLYRELITLHDLMENGSYLTMSNHMSSMIRDRTSTKLLKSCAMMKDTCADLIGSKKSGTGEISVGSMSEQLTLFNVTLPGEPPLKRCCIKDITTEKVMKNLPSLPRSKSGEVQKVIEALLKAVNYRHHMVTQEVKNLKEDNVCMILNKDLHTFRDGYANFEQSTNEIIVKPLKDILDAFEDLNNTASEDAFKEFLKKFKHNSEQLKNAVEKLDTTDCSSENGALGALSQYGQEFFSTLDKLVSQSQRTRDKAAKSSQQQERLEEELRNILDEQELKYREHFETDNSHNSRYIPEVKEEDETSGNISGRISEGKPSAESEMCISGRKSKQKKIKEHMNDGRKSHNKDILHLNDKDHVNQELNEDMCISGRKSIPGKLGDDLNLDNDNSRKSYALANFESDDVCVSGRKSKNKSLKEGGKTGRKSQQSEMITPIENGLPSQESEDGKCINVNRKKTVQNKRG